ncbi:MAG TPA: hypothetical protein VF884_07245 [Nitrososphaeraceae archaeon]
MVCGITGCKKPTDNANILYIEGTGLEKLALCPIHSNKVKECLEFIPIVETADEED